MRKQIVWAIVAVALVAGGYYLFTHKPTIASSAPGGKGRFGGTQTVGVAQVSSGNVDVTLTALGTITPASTVTVHSRVDGQLMKLGFADGQLVKQGDVLAELDARPYQAALLQAQGQMTRDQALLANAKIDLDRFQTLFAQDSIAKQQLDAQASLVRQYQGAVQSDQGNIDNAKLQIVYSRVQAPISGRVGIRQVDLGNIVHSGDANGIVVITQLQPIEAIFAVPQDNLPVVMQRLTAGEVMAVTAWDRDDKTQIASGTLLAVDNQVDTTTGTVKFKAEFKNADNSLFANEFVNIHMVLQTLQNTMLVPTAAVLRGTQGTFVYVVNADDKTVHMRTVTSGPAQGQLTSVTSGLQLGETVVVDGTDRLRDGAKVAIGGAGAVSDTTPKSGFGQASDADSNTISATQPTADVSGTHGGHHHRRGADGAPAQSE